MRSAATAPTAAAEAPTPAPDLASAVAALGVNAAMAEGQQQQQQQQQGMVGGSMWTEEFIQQATAQFEQTMRAIMEQQQGLRSTIFVSVQLPYCQNIGYSYLYPSI